MGKIIGEIAGTVFLSIACEMMAPESSVKKYLRLALGFVMMVVMLRPLSAGRALPEFDFDFDSALSSEELEAQSDALVLSLHKKNIEKRIEEICGEGSRAYAEILTDGRVKSIRVVCDKKFFGKRNEIISITGCSDVEMAEDDQ